MRSAWFGELTKVATVRAQWLGLVMATLTIPVTSLLVAASGGLSSSDSVTAGAATGSAIGLVAFGSWAGVLAAGEYASQTIMVSLSTVPRRSAFYTAKLAALTSLAAAGALVSMLTALPAVWAATPHGAHPFGNPARLLAVVVSVAAVTAIGAALGILLRSSTAAIVGVVVLVLLPQAAGGLLGALQPWVVGASPGAVITQTAGSSQLATDQAFPSGSLAALATLLAVSILVAGVGSVALQHRDG